MADEKNYAEIIEQFTDGLDAEKFKNAIHELQTVSFVVKNHPKAEKKVYYDYIRRHFYAFDAVFRHLLGYEIHIDEVNGVIYLQDIGGGDYVPFSKDESIVILIFCLLYQEKVKELSLANGVYVTSEEVREYIKNVKGKYMAARPYQEILRKLKKYNLIYSERDASKDDTVSILVLPSVLYVLKRDGLDKEYKKQEMFESAQTRLDEYTVNMLDLIDDDYTLEDEDDEDSEGDKNDE